MRSLSIRSLLERAGAGTGEASARLKTARRVQTRINIVKYCVLRRDGVKSSTSRLTESDLR